MATLATRGFFSLGNIGKNDTLGDGQGGGRVDLKKQINDIDFTLSLTDATARDYENAPAAKDLLLTADKRVNDNLVVGAGYDAGAKGFFASATAAGDISERPVSGTATWFQRGNVVRTEGTIKFDGDRSKLWAAHTFNAEGANVMNRTYVNLVERQGFLIEPFAINVATSGAKYTLQKDDYVIEPAYDFNRDAGYVTVSRKWHHGILGALRDHTTVKAGYAFKDEVALLELNHTPDNVDLPHVRVFAKAPLGSDGIGRVSAGVILDRHFDL